MAETKLMTQFGCSPITPELKDRIRHLTGQSLHPFLERNFFFSHRDLNLILDDYENNRPFYLYTGRGPSSGSFHLGHLIPFLFTAHLQKLFGAPVVIQITDDEKFLFRDCTLEEIEHNTKENIKDIISCNFDPDKTFIFTNLDYVQNMYKNVIQIQSCLTNNQVFATFGLTGSNNIGQTAFCAMQIAPCLSTTFPFLPKNARCLVPQGIDQDPYFRLARDICPRLGYKKPSLIHSKFMPSLQGVHTKMSSSKPETAIFLTDPPKQIRKKINACVSGGCEKKEEQLVRGANLEVDIPFKLLEYFLDDSLELEDIRRCYGMTRASHCGVTENASNETGPKMLTGMVKRRAIEVITAIIFDHQECRKLVTDKLIEKFCSM
jgi:tryptophanyl-tRNA synthetase